MVWVGFSTVLLHKQWQAAFGPVGYKLPTTVLVKTETHEDKYRCFLGEGIGICLPLDTSILDTQSGETLAVIITCSVMVERSKPQLSVPLSGYCSDILRMDSTNADALYVRGLCLYYEDCIEKAVQFFVQALRMAPDHEKACVACRVSSRPQI